MTPHDGPEPVEALFLDIGGVLLTNGWDRRARQRACELFHLDFAEVDERHHLTFDIYEEGKLELDGYLERTIFYEPRPFSHEEFREFLFAQSQPYPEMIGLIRRLKERYRLKIAAVSNEGRELTVHRIEKFRLGEVVDFFIASCFVHFRKPDTDIFCIASDIAQVRPEFGVFIDDRAMFVEVARGLGFHGIHHTSLQDTCDHLAYYGLVDDNTPPDPQAMRRTGGGDSR
jgi:putative hydrolase of the HAD superfamily